MFVLGQRTEVGFLPKAFSLSKYTTVGSQVSSDYTQNSPTLEFVASVRK